MKYIYTVKPLKDALKIAIENDLSYSVSEDGHLTIYGIDAENWPAGVSISSTERINSLSIYNVGPYKFAVALPFFTETAENEVPEFIKSLYEALTENCLNVNCEDCPLHLINEHTDYTCSELISWTKKRWFS